MPTSIDLISVETLSPALSVVLKISCGRLLLSNHCRKSLMMMSNLLWFRPFNILWYQVTPTEKLSSRFVTLKIDITKLDNYEQLFSIKVIYHIWESVKSFRL